MCELRCNKCCRKVYADGVLTYFPNELKPTQQEFICLKCWGEMSADDKKNEETINWIPPYLMVI